MSVNHQATTELEHVISGQRFGAVIFNLDGVVTRINEVHAAAWKQLFDTFMLERTAHVGENLNPFHINLDYRRYIEGRPRHLGVTHFLSSRHIELPMGEPGEPASGRTICGLANRKKQIFRGFIEEQGVQVYGCAIALIHRLRSEGFKTAFVSASAHCDMILDKAGIGELFDDQIDGIEAKRLELDGKPDPYVLLEVVRRLEMEPEDAIVIEDSVVGVTAGSRGRFGQVIGIDDGDQSEWMLEHGADYVLQDLCRVHVEGKTDDEGFSPPVLTDMSLITNQVAGKQPVLFLDYGGTLTPTISEPEDAELSKKMRRALRKAARLMPVTIVSGRDVEELCRLVGLPELTYAGSHGLEIRGPDMDLVLPDGLDVLDDLDKGMDELTLRLSEIPGIGIERKRFAIVVHYRKKDTLNAAYAEAAVEEVQMHLPKLRKTGGKEVFELLPDIDWDKGRAVNWLLAEMGLEGPDKMPLYFGDDITDEDAFRSVRGVGLGILVTDRPQPSMATYRVNDSGKVLSLLLHLTSEFKHDH